MPDSPTTRAAAVQEEQVRLDEAEHRRGQLLADVLAQLDRPTRDRTDAQLHALLARRAAALTAADHGLVLGRIDTVDGRTHRIGRLGLSAADGGEPLVIDWRAEAARPFYTATALAPQGLQRRRHIRTDGPRVLAVDDEDLVHGGADGAAELVGEAALLSALDERRTGRMGTAVATLQREQDEIVRADDGVPLVVQGGPGTGKTVVALHRVAYLLFSHPETAQRGVLLLGPSRRFLEYVAQVLPALGETAVVAATCDTLLPGVRAEREESREIAEIKGRPLWQRVLADAVAEIVPAAAPLTLRLDGEQVRLGAAAVAAALRAGLAGGRSVGAAREVALEALREAVVETLVEASSALVASVEEGFEDVLGSLDAALARSDDRAARTHTSSGQVDGELSDADVETLREQVAADAGIGAALDRWWPRHEPATLLQRLLHEPAWLARLAPELTSAEVAALADEPGALAPSDLPLLDAVSALLGAAAPTAAADDPEPFVAARAAADPFWTYGHVVVDEAQELSPMQWQMVRRRCPTGSITAVGDIDQASSPHPHTSWDEALTPVLGERWRRADLTICYRTPREVMALVGPVLRAAGSHNDPPRAVRSSGREPTVVTVAAGALPAAVVDATTALGERYAGGTVGVVASTALIGGLRAALPAVPVLSAEQAKGLEWDACVVVDPDGIAAAPRGWNALYVALTRCTQELVQVRPR